MQDALITDTPAPKRKPGRPAGSKNKRTDALDAARASTGDKIRAAIGPNAFSGDAWEYLLSVYADPANCVTTRIAAARAAIRYERPALASTEVTGANGSPLAPAGPPVIHVQFVDPEPDRGE
jgi:hypothetical protein